MDPKRTKISVCICEKMHFFLFCFVNQVLETGMVKGPRAYFSVTFRFHETQGIERK